MKIKISKKKIKSIIVAVLLSALCILGYYYGATHGFYSNILIPVNKEKALVFRAEKNDGGILVEPVDICKNPGEHFKFFPMDRFAAFALPCMHEFFAIAGNKLIYYYNGTLTCLDADNGGISWEKEVKPGELFNNRLSSNILSDGSNIYVIINSNNNSVLLWALTINEGKELWQKKTPSFSIFVQPFLAEKYIIFQFPLKTLIVEKTSGKTTVVKSCGGVLKENEYIYFSSCTYKKSLVNSIDLSTMKKKYLFKTGPLFDKPVARYNDSLLYFTDKNKEICLESLSLTTGKKTWTTRVANIAPDTTVQTAFFYVPCGEAVQWHTPHLLRGPFLPVSLTGKNSEGKIYYRFKIINLNDGSITADSRPVPVSRGSTYIFHKDGYYYLVIREERSFFFDKKVLLLVFDPAAGIFKSAAEIRYNSAINGTSLFYEIKENRLFISREDELVAAGLLDQTVLYGDSKYVVFHDVDEILERFGLGKP
ncbi:MAG: PQQ-binding-like beta-propeller repeat protein [bacterium]|nr:PQQ-binding-like beta-propeller repeat protein [bacterium]